jgi:hypothetical protein
VEILHLLAPHLLAGIAGAFYGQSLSHPAHRRSLAKAILCSGARNPTQLTDRYLMEEHVRLRVESFNAFSVEGGSRIRLAGLPKANPRTSLSG